MVKDLYGQYDGTIDNYSVSPNYSVAAMNDRGGLILAHIEVNVATNGLENKLLIYWGPTAGTAPNIVPDFSALKDFYIEIGEYNAGNSYRLLNQGASDAPVFVDRSGVVTAQL